MTRRPRAASTTRENNATHTSPEPRYERDTMNENDTTVHEHLCRMWGAATRVQEDLLWPPNMFASSSALFAASGCYRSVVSTASVQTRRLRRQRRLALIAEAWIDGLSSVLVGEAGSESVLQSLDVAKLVDECVTLSKSVTMNDLRLHAAPGAATTKHATSLVAALMDLHAISDLACAQYGLLGGSSRSGCVAKCLAELMLTSMGTMSTLPKQFGIVAPKMRTPQSGLSLRSLSHHLAFSATEVEIAWRAFPWPNEHENSVNILALPWPMVVRDTQFSTAEDALEVVRYFDYAQSEPNDMVGGPIQKEPWGFEVVDEIVKRVQHAMKNVEKLHLVVLPELALDRKTFDALLDRLTKTGLKAPTQLPMIIAGVASEEPRSAPGGETSPVNEVQLAAFFAGRWYRLSQRKHHRWKLDRNQIIQYGLQGRLGTMRGTFERMAISQRRLGIFAPTGWLALTPLICEDLAQLEPVSEVIRAIGPNLLIALLLDGPQLRDRWSARYASVLADDPGTAVLTLTAAGMVARSRPVGATSAAAPSACPDGGLCVGLWRDPVSGWRELRLPEGDDSLIISLSASSRVEYTADGRSDGGAAALIQLDGYSTFGAIGLPDVTYVDRRQVKIRRWDDLRELASATHALDATLYLGTNATKKVANLVLGVANGSVEVRGQLEHLPEFLRRAVTALWRAQRDPKGNGTSAGDSTGTVWETKELKAALEKINEITEELSDSGFFPSTDQLRKTDGDPEGYEPDDLRTAEALAERAFDLLSTAAEDHGGDESDNNEAWAQHVALPRMLLTLLHDRLQRYRGFANDERAHHASDNDVTVERVTRLVQKIERVLRGEEQGT